MPAKATEAVSAARARSELNIGVDLVAAAAAPELPGLQAALLGQPAGQPAGGASLLVVDGRAVGLEDQLNSHEGRA